MAATETKLPVINVPELARAGPTIPRSQTGIHDNKQPQPNRAKRRGSFSVALVSSSTTPRVSVSTNNVDKYVNLLESSRSLGEKSPREDLPQVEIQYGVSSIQGRRETQEDAHMAIPTTGPKGMDGFFAVYDGHGGQACADFVSQALHQNILSSPSFDSGDIEKAMVDGFLKTDREWMALAKKHEGGVLQDGSTAVVALLRGQTLYVANVGDSEAVLCRGGDKAVPLTVVHNPKKNNDEIKRVEEAGGRVYMRRVGHPRFNPRIMSIAVSRAFGDIGYKDPDFTDKKPSGIICAPNIATVQLQPTDSFLILACDGLWDVMEHQEAVDFVRSHQQDGADIQTTCDDLTNWAYVHGSQDNITVMVLTFSFPTPGLRRNVRGDGKPLELLEIAVRNTLSERSKSRSPHGEKRPTGEKDQKSGSREAPPKSANKGETGKIPAPKEHLPSDSDSDSDSSSDKERARKTSTAKASEANGRGSSRDKGKDGDKDSKDKDAREKDKGTERSAGDEEEQDSYSDNSYSEGTGRDKEYQKLRARVKLLDRALSDQEHSLNVLRRENRELHKALSRYEVGRAASDPDMAELAAAPPTNGRGHSRNRSVDDLRPQHIPLGRSPHRDHAKQSVSPGYREHGKVVKGPDREKDKADRGRDAPRRVEKARAG